MNIDALLKNADWPKRTPDKLADLNAKKKGLTASNDSSSISLGGQGSGNFGHAGRPGEVGGSASEGESEHSGGHTDVSRVPLQDRPSAEAFIEARNASARIGYLSPLTADDLKDQRLYLSTDGTVGGAMTKDGDMGNLFNNHGPKGAAREVLLQMMADGGKTADAFDGYLPQLYANFGLRETGRMTFNPEYAPKGWNYAEDDHPDVVFLALTGEAGTIDDIRERLDDDSKWIDPRDPTDTYYDDYDLAKRDATAAAHASEKRRGGEAPRTLRTDAWRGLGAEARRDGAEGSPRSRRSVGDHRLFLLRFQLGGEGSGNFGHAGRPGEVGGSASTEGTKGISFSPDDEGKRLIGSKKDGGRAVVTPSPISAETQRRVLGEMTVEQVVGQMIEDLPGDLKVTWGSRSTGATAVGGRKAGVHAPEEDVIVFIAEGDGYKMHRSFKRNKDGTLTARHHMFEMHGGAQGRGLAKAVLADAMHTYQQLGVDRITMHANMEVGGYAWAKFGFEAIDPTVAAKHMTRVASSMADEDEFTDDERGQLVDVLNQYANDPKLPWHVAGTVTAAGKPIGKSLLTKSQWEAQLRLDDQAAMARFDHYVKGH